MINLQTHYWVSWVGPDQSSWIGREQTPPQESWPRSPAHVKKKKQRGILPCSRGACKWLVWVGFLFFLKKSSTNLGKSDQVHSLTRPGSFNSVVSLSSDSGDFWWVEWVSGNGQILVKCIWTGPGPSYNLINVGTFLCELGWGPPRPKKNLLNVNEKGPLFSFSLTKSLAFMTLSIVGYIHRPSSPYECVYVINR